MASPRARRTQRPHGQPTSKSAGTGTTPFDALYRAGLKHLDAHEYPEAIAQFEAALLDNPPPDKQAAVLFGLANAARRIGHPRAAEAFYGRVLAIDPTRIEALVNLANLHRSTGRLREAQILIAEALSTDPEAPELWLTLANIMRDMDDTTSADTFLTEALRLKPGYPAALAGQADLLVDRGEPARALETYAAALRKDPTNPQIHFNRSLVLLSEGHLAEGWRDYAFRLQAASPPLRPTHNLKPWKGEALTKGKLLISAEQGLGDQLIFASCFADTIARAGAVHTLIECELRLIPLFARSFPQASVHPLKARDQGGVRILDYDWLEAEGGATHVAAMGDLPALLRPSIESCPKTTAYLRPDTDKSCAWRRWLGQLPDGPLIGLCWRSGKMSGSRTRQFAPMSAWAEFLHETPGVFVSLQYDGTPEEIASLTEASGREIHVPPGLDQKNDLDGAAALMSGLDAVVTAPTAVSAISAAVGTPTLKILFDRSWTALGQSYEPLSPACRLMRPDTPGDWASAFAKARRALEADPWVQLSDHPA